ncbi:hypothetical protein PNOK_m000131 (mitochondrion) [Pyrrhoderma noxium]|uniref:Uncharacterized protein n=1 Tax=Pyrrhoderma noxium TaxID=2282107 RepID=A0A541AXS6_9AGAM|nr:hypothetical protein PNOK_m000131 [Pyrrhoderma noxium]
MKNSSSSAFQSELNSYMQLETDINVDVENVPSITISSAGESNETLFTETENKINIANNLRVETSRRHFWFYMLLFSFEILNASCFGLLTLLIVKLITRLKSASFHSF